MLLQAVKPFRLKIRGHAQLVALGEVLTLGHEDAEKFLSKFPWLVKVLPTVTWMSPLFGRCSGTVLMADELEVLVDHPITGEPAWIMREWIMTEAKP